MPDFQVLGGRTNKTADLIGRWFTVYTALYGVYLFAVGHYKLVKGHHHFFLVVLVASTLILACWVGYLLRTLKDWVRPSFFGFKILSEIITYSVDGHDHYTLDYSIDVKACENNLKFYPIRYNWTGGGEYKVPKVSGDGQYLMAVFDKEKEEAAPYIEQQNSHDLGLSSYFIAFNPPLSKKDKATIEYSQEFHDLAKVAKPLLDIIPMTSVDKLTLRVKLPIGVRPSTIATRTFKPGKPDKPIKKDGKALFDKPTGLITWVPNNPRRGYLYRIGWTLPDDGTTMTPDDKNRNGDK